MSEQSPLTEPEIIPCLFVSDFEIEVADTAVVRMVGWVRLPVLGGETEERRIVIRCAITNSRARSLQVALHKALARGEQ